MHFFHARQCSSAWCSQADCIAAPKIVTNIRGNVLLTDLSTCVGHPLLQRQRLHTNHNRDRLSLVRSYGSMETGQSTSTVSVSPPEILAGKEIQPSAPKAILRTDYRPTPYLVSDVHLTFLLGDTTRVKSKLSCLPNYEGSPPALALDGRLMYALWLAQLQKSCFTYMAT